MTTSTLAKNYDRLTPAERYPAVIAAHRRGDKLETARLMRSAPQIVLRSSNVWQLVLAWYGLSAQYLLVMLDFAARYTQFMIALEGAERDGNDDLAEKFDAALEILAHRLHVENEGWAQLCSENNLTAGDLLDGLPGVETLGMMLAFVAHLEPQADAIRALLPPEQHGDIPTVADCLECWRMRLDAEMDLHGVAKR